MIAPICITRSLFLPDTLTAANYRGMYTRVKEQARTYRKVVELLKSSYSPAWWCRYEHGELNLTRTAKNELRDFVFAGLPHAELGPTVIEAIAEMDVDPHADIWRIGDARPTRIIALNHNHRVTIKSGWYDLEVIDAETPFSDEAETPAGDDDETVPVTSVTRSQRRHSLSISDDLWVALNKTRQAANLTWREFLAPLIAAP